MSPPRSWPQRFRIILINIEGGSARYSVLTWLSQEKAIAMAVAEHLRRHGEAATIHDIAIEDLGPASAGPGGKVQVARDDLFDRMEF